MKAGEVAGGRGRSFPLAEVIGYAVVVTAVWLAWEVIKAPLMDRATPALAVRLAPGSPEVLRRAAEAELAAGRVGNAEALSNESLSKAPFSARALRVRGLSEAKRGSADRADEMLTLAGNWSLRDGPAHAWLTEHRLRRGDYGSAFAHADTLARRREDIHPALFRLFTVAAAQDPRSAPSLARILSARPPWRRSYLNSLPGQPQGDSVLGWLAVTLEPTDGRFTTDELRTLYVKWAEEGRFDGIREVQRRIGRPSPSTVLQNGDFSTGVEDQLIPFGWSFGTSPGFSTAVTEDDVRAGNLALRLEYDGFSSGVFVEQLLLLGPGRHILKGERRAEAGQANMQLGWEVVCAETAAVISPTDRGPWSAAGAWERFEIGFDVPRENCGAQWLRLKARPEDRRTTIAAWFDELEVLPGTK